MTHSIVPPSSAGIYGKPDGCTYWVTMNQMYPETEPTIESMEGEASHDIGADLIDGYARAKHNPKAETYVGKVHPNGVVYTDEMFEGAKMYADDVSAVMQKHQTFTPHIEERLEMPDIHELSFGTPDCWLYLKKAREIILWDYKFGYEVVEAFENWQAITYLNGVLRFLEINGLEDQVTTVRIRIAQPRAQHRDDPIREWVVKASDLRGYFNTLHANAHKALSADAECNTGKHCKHCPGRHACEPALTAGTRLFEATGAPMPVELSDNALGFQLTLIKRALKQLEYLESGFEEQLKSRVKSGALIPGWVIEPSFGRAKWNHPVADVLAMGEMFNVDLRKNEAIIPNQAIKLGVDEAVTTAYSTKPNTGVKVVPDNNNAKRVFS